MELHTIQFPTTKEILKSMSDGAKLLLSGTPTIAEVSEKLKEVSSARIAIEKTGKAMRDTATAYSRDVMDQQKALIGYIEDAEKALKTKKDEMEHYEKLDKNMHKLGPRQEELKQYEYEHEDVEELILMTEHQRNKLLQTRKEIYLLKKEKELQEKQKQIEIEKAREEAKKEAKEELKEEVKQEIVEEKKQEEKKQKEIAEKLDADFEFNQKLIQNGYNERTDKYKVSDGVCTIYRIISQFSI